MDDLMGNNRIEIRAKSESVSFFLVQVIFME